MKFSLTRQDQVSRGARQTYCDASRESKGSPGNSIDPLTDILGEDVAITSGMNHLGLAVRDLNETARFFTDCLGWDESGRDDSYPRTAVSDGVVRLTLWQVADADSSARFDRRKNIGLHHVAFSVDSYESLMDVAARLRSHSEVVVEFEPELLGSGPRMHMMCNEPGGLRVEFIWSGE